MKMTKTSQSSIEKQPRHAVPACAVAGSSVAQAQTCFAVLRWSNRQAKTGQIGDDLGNRNPPRDRQSQRGSRRGHDRTIGGHRIAVQ